MLDPFVSLSIKSGDTIITINVPESKLTDFVSVLLLNSDLWFRVVYPDVLSFSDSSFPIDSSCPIK